DDYIRGLIETTYSGDSNLFLKALAAQGTAVEEVRERHRQSDLVAGATQEKVAVIPQPTPEQTEQYYHSHEKDFRVDESVELSLIVLKKNPTNRLATVESQRKDAAAIHARLIAGADFAAEAKLHSQGTRAQQGGDLGWLERKLLRKDLADAAFSLKPGGLSDVIETEEDCIIMQVADRRPGALKPLADVRVDILKTLQTQQRSAVISQWLGKLRAKAFLRYYAHESDVTARSQDRILEIEIKHIGVSTVSDAVIRSHLCVKESELVTQTSVDNDIRSLYDMGDFSNVRAAVQIATGGINLTYVMQERPMLTDIQFTGNTNISSSELLQNLTSKTGDRMDERKLFN